MNATLLQVPVVSLLHAAIFQEASPVSVTLGSQETALPAQVGFSISTTSRID